MAAAPLASGPEALAAGILPQDLVDAPRHAQFPQHPQGLGVGHELGHRPHVEAGRQFHYGPDQMTADGVLDQDAYEAAEAGGRVQVLFSISTNGDNFLRIFRFLSRKESLARHLCHKGVA